MGEKKWRVRNREYKKKKNISGKTPYICEEKWHWKSKMM